MPFVLASVSHLTALYAELYWFERCRTMGDVLMATPGDNVSTHNLSSSLQQQHQYYVHTTESKDPDLEYAAAGNIQDRTQFEADKQAVYR